MAHCHESRRTRDMDTISGCSSSVVHPHCGSSGSFIIETDPYALTAPHFVTAQRHAPLHRGCLHPGAKFKGKQMNKRNVYDVLVELTDVDLHTSTVGGYLKIFGLTKECPEITTYFDGEIVGSHFSFSTGKWDATQTDDLRHWTRFPTFTTLHREIGRLTAPIDNKNSNYVYMRWKERFLVPDHRVSQINGASFAGFYYIQVALTDTFEEMTTRQPSREQRTPTLSEDEEYGDDPLSHTFATNTTRHPGSDAAKISQQGHLRGFYFHENSEPFQELSLHYVPLPTSSAFEFL